jgi:biopolymer transport protein ExbD
MNRIRQRRLDRAAAADLDVTPFMNLMIVLVPVLLLSMTLTHTRIIDLELPWGTAAETLVDAETVRFEVVVDSAGFAVRDGRGAAIATIPRQGDAWDYRGLSDVMLALKRKVPEKRDVALLLTAEVSYQTLISVMDAVRARTALEQGAPVTMELFPVISLGDAPAEPVDGVATLTRSGPTAPSAQAMLQLAQGGRP